MKRLPLTLLLALAAAGCGPPTPAPPPPPASDATRSREARLYIEFFKTVDTQQWELAKERLLRLGPSVIPTLFAAMEEEGGEVDLNCADVLRRMGADALPAMAAEIQRGDAGYAGKALSRRRAFRRSLISTLGDLRTPAATDALARILRDDAWVTARRNAAFCLGVRKDRRSVPQLIESLRKDPDEAVRAEARGALKAFAGGKDMGGANADAWDLWWQKQQAGGA